MENRTRANSFYSSHIWSSHLLSLFVRSFPSTRTIYFQNLHLSLDYGCLFIDFFCILWPCRPEIMGLFTLSIHPLLVPLCFSLFLDIFCSSAIKKIRKWICSQYFRYWTDVFHRFGFVIYVYSNFINTKNVPRYIRKFTVGRRFLQHVKMCSSSVPVHSLSST